MQGAYGMCPEPPAARDSMATGPQPTGSEAWILSEWLCILGQVNLPL